MKIKGLDKALKELRALDKKASQGIIQSLEVAGVEAVAVMQSNTPVDLGKLRQGNSFAVYRDELKVILFNNVPYAPFVEFGTGSKVDVPNELKELAIQFKGQKSGSFDVFLEQIKDWCKRKGIDEKLAYPIAASILRKGIHPHPFLYPGLLKGRQVFLKQIQLLVKNLK